MTNKYTQGGIEHTIDNIDKKLDVVDEKLHIINQTLVKNTASLEEHMRRSLKNEEAVDALKKELHPVVIHVAAVQIVVKIILTLITTGILYKAIQWIVVK